MANIPGSAWMDTDGKHVWWDHQCVNGEMKRAMLPYPHWKNDGAETPRITPSIVCTVPGCNYHEHPHIGKPPADWTPRKSLDELSDEADRAAHER